jgi:hypothetical protein
VANARAAKTAVAATAVNSAERRESMVEVLLAFNVVVLQRAMVARSHKLPGTHQLSVCESGRKRKSSPGLSKE